MSEKDFVHFQPEDNHETRIAESDNFLKNYWFKHELKITFFLIFFVKQRGLKR